MSETGYSRSMQLHRNRFLSIVREPPDCSEARKLTKRFAVIEYLSGEDLKTYDQSEDYFRFMFHDGVEPTNNHAEQQIRHCVIDRKITQGTRSAAGQRYHERMWTAIATCAKQSKSFFEFLFHSIDAKINRKQPPSLLIP